jgi:hypothetical protein
MHGPKTRGLGDLAAGGGGGGAASLSWEGNPAKNGSLVVDFGDAAVTTLTHTVQFTIYSTAGNAVLGPEDWTLVAGVVTSLKREEVSGFSQPYRTTDRVSVAIIPLTAGVVVS